MTLDALRSRLRGLADPEDARNLQRFFKTGPGEYGEGDLFLGIRVPVLRRLAKEAAALPLEDAEELLRSPYHEKRLLALLILVRAHAKGDAALRERIHATYLANTRYVNNWDLVDSSAEHLVGAHLRDGDRGLLDRLAASDSVWERRIAVIATFHFIKRGELADTLRIAGLLLSDRHDLVHKAVGWMLREVGKRDREAEEAFLREHCRTMPRTMLRYAVERFPEPLRLAYLRGEPASAPTESA
ncbi:MAG: DNA alkylation repair protein [Gemmatimonadota bacterium]